MEMSNIVMSVLKIIYYFCVCLLDFCVSQFCCSTLIINEDGPDERRGGLCM